MSWLGLCRLVHSLALAWLVSPSFYLQLQHALIRKCFCLLSLVVSPNKQRGTRHQTFRPRQVLQLGRRRICVSCRLVCFPRSATPVMLSLWRIESASYLVSKPSYRLFVAPGDESRCQGCLYESGLIIGLPQDESQNGLFPCAAYSTRTSTEVRSQLVNYPRTCQLPETTRNGQC